MRLVACGTHHARRSVSRLHAFYHSDTSPALLPSAGRCATDYGSRAAPLVCAWPAHPFFDAGAAFHPGEVIAPRLLKAAARVAEGRAASLSDAAVGAARARICSSSAALRSIPEERRQPSSLAATASADAASSSPHARLRELLRLRERPPSSLLFLGGPSTVAVAEEGREAGGGVGATAGFDSAAAALARAQLLREAATAAESDAAQRSIARLREAMAGQGGPVGGGCGVDAAAPPSQEGDAAAAAAARQQQQLAKRVVSAAICVGRWAQLAGERARAVKEEGAAAAALSVKREAAAAHARRLCCGDGGARHIVGAGQRSEGRWQRGLAPVL